MELMNQAFGGINELKLKKSERKPELERLQCYQIGAERRLYIEMLIFYEDKANFDKAEIEHHELKRRTLYEQIRRDE
jgi:hypothetical protein